MLTLATDESSMANWISDQLDESKTPLSSHREYFRKRLNPRMVQLGKFGRDGPKVCEVNSRWRGFAFTKKDYSEYYVWFVIIVFGVRLDRLLCVVEGLNNDLC